MANRKEMGERRVWRLFQCLVGKSTYRYFRKSESPDFIKGNHGVELTRYIQDMYDDPHNGDHGWERRYQDFARKCNQLWLDRFPGRPLPTSVSYIPHLSIRRMKRQRFSGKRIDECAADFVTYVSMVEQATVLNDEDVGVAGGCLARYFQSVYVTPYRRPRNKFEAKCYKRWPGWGYPKSGGGISAGSRIEEIVAKKRPSLLKYASNIKRVDLLLYADGETLASSLLPFVEGELRERRINGRPFGVIWLLDVPGRKLIRVQLLPGKGL